MQFSLDDAYKEACTALGEEVILNRLLRLQLAQLSPATPQQPPDGADA